MEAGWYEYRDEETGDIIAGPFWYDPNTMNAPENELRSAGKIGKISPCGGL